MKKVLFLLSVVTALSCKYQHGRPIDHVKPDTVVKDRFDDIEGYEPYVRPMPWTYQDIDRVPACKILPCTGLQIISFPHGNTYTAVYYMAFGRKWYKQNKASSGFDFLEGNPYYYTDSCKLKEDLRAFIKAKMVDYISENLR